jgi:poly(3-hydroxybutyrate) depolymerase
MTAWATPDPTLLTRGVQPLPRTKSGKLATVSVPEGGRFVERSYTNSAGTRSYKLYISSGYTGQAVSLIVLLHGCTQNPDDFATGTRMNELSEEHTFLVAYPAQAGNANMQRCWNWFQAAHQQRGRGEPSLIAGITRQVVEEYDVAEGRVYVGGRSDGRGHGRDLSRPLRRHRRPLGSRPGSANDMSSAFTAMRQGGPVVASRRAPNGESTEIVPTIVFHGYRDTTVHPRNGERLMAHPDIAGGQNGSSPRVRTHQSRVPGGYEYTRFTYRDAQGRDTVERWSVHGLGHAWSGGSYPGSYTDPKGPDASAEMVRFFGQHHKR